LIQLRLARFLTRFASRPDLGHASKEAIELRATTRCAPTAGNLNCVRYASEDVEFLSQKSDTIDIELANNPWGDSTDMCKQMGMLSALLLCFAGLAAYGQDSPIQVEIKPSQTKVNNYETFSVATEMRNTSTDEQSIELWSCSYPTQWVSDNPVVRFNLVGCKKNDLLTIKLKPGKTLDRVLSVRIELPAEGDPIEEVTFRMGFKTATSLIGHENLPNWSRPVTVSVTK
jgi:hypothetical protein